MECSTCFRAEAVFDNNGGLCERCWWTWWFEDYTDEDLERLVSGEDEPKDDYPEESVQAGLELELRRARRAPEAAPN